jgi:Tol biopolymer transport system component
MTLRGSRLIGLLALLLLVGACGGGGGGAGGNPPPPPPPPPAKPGVLQFGAASFTANENTRAASITITRTDGSDGQVSVTVATEDGTARAADPDNDYEALTATTVTFAAGDAAAKTVTVELNDDRKAELDETLTLKLSGANLGAANTTATLTIQDTDPFAAFIARQSAGEPAELFVIDLSQRKVKVSDLSGAPNSAGNVTEFLWAPDHSRLAYVADRNEAEVFELFSVVANGSAAPVRLNAELVTDSAGTIGDVLKFAWSPDSTQLAYVADQEVDQVLELFTVSADVSAAPVKVRDGLAIEGKDIFNFAWSPDGRHIAYELDQGNPEFLGPLFVASFDPNGVVENVQLSNLGVSSFAWSPNRDRVAFVQHRPGDLTSFDLFSIPSDRSDGPQKLNPQGANGANESVSDFVWSPDGTMIAYRSDRAQDGKLELFKIAAVDEVVNASDVDLETVNPALTVPGSEVFALYAWAPNSRHLAFRTDPTINQRIELFKADIPVAIEDDVSGRRALHDAFPNTAGDGADVQRLAWSPDSTRVAFLADADTEGVFELFSNSASNPAEQVVLHVNLQENRTVSAFEWSPDGKRLFYLADQDTDDVSELFSVLVEDDNNPATKISGDLGAGGTVLLFRLAPPEPTAP